MYNWVKLPTTWILNKENPLLRRYSWRGDIKSDYIAALMLYITIATHASRENTDDCPLGCAKLSYSKFCLITSLSRSKVSNGLNILIRDNLIEKYSYNKTNIYKIVNYENRGGWGKLPARILYDDYEEYIIAFSDFKLRQKVELDSLKLYLLLIALRDNYLNHATPSYDTINRYTGIIRTNIRSAISQLVNHDLIHVQKYGDPSNLEKRRNYYRIIGIDDKRHAGNMTYESFEEESDSD